MARMIPATLSLETESRAEGKMFYALRKSLDDSYTVFHSFDLLARNRENKFIDAEIDFLIFWQARGLLSLEVKGGILAYDNKGRWLQNGNPLKQSPYNQAKNGKYAVSDYLRKRLGDVPPMILGHAVCFPDVFSEMSNLPADADPSITITGSLVNHLNEVIPDIFKNFKEDKHRFFNAQESESVRKALIPVFEYGTSLVDLMGAAERKIFALTEEQCEWLDTLGDRRRALIQGGAGTGKTCMALKKAKELAFDGKRVLLLCYNIPLSGYLNKTVKDYQGDITATNYGEFCLGKLREAGVVFEYRYDEDSFWRKVLPDRFDKYLDGHQLKYDAIIIDEGQDFPDLYWITIEKLLASNGYLFIFYDPDQNIYRTDLQFPVIEKPFILNINCRNTRNICEELAKYTTQKIKVKDDVPEGKPIVEIPCSSNHECRKKLSQLLHDLINKEKISPERIVILGGHNIKHTCIGNDSKVGNFIIKRDPEGGSNNIRYDTYMRFKGLEADVVIVLEVDPKDERWKEKSALNTAISRTKFLLYIIPEFCAK